MKPSAGLAPERYVCVGCGHDIVDRQVFDVGSLSPMLKGCSICIGKYGVAKLRVEADRLLAEFERRQTDKIIPAAKKGKCWHCDAPTLRDLTTGSYAMWCSDCERERLRLVELGQNRVEGTL